MKESDAPFDRWHKKYPKPGDAPCRCGTKRNPQHPTADHGRGQQWQARYTDPNGKPRRPMFVTWQEARDHLDEVRASIRTGTWIDPDIGIRKLEFFANELIEGRKKRKKNENTTNTYDTHLRVHILPFAGRREAKSLKRRDTMALVDHLLDKPGIGDYYTVQIFKTWRILMNYMIDSDVPLPANITSRIELPEIDPRVKVSLLPQQVANLAAAMREIAPRYEILIWIAACAGFREGEAFGLREEDVGWADSVLYVTEQRQNGQAKKLKTKASKVTLPVDRFLTQQLASHRTRFSGPEPVGRDAEMKRRRRGYAPPPDEGLIVTTRDGKPMRRGRFNEKFREAVTLAGLPERTRYHDLKHFYTSQLGASGRHDPKTVQALSRHAEFSETWDTYAHPPMAVEGVKVITFSGLFTTIRDRVVRAAA
ncbi:tyrosine-type recombinase/integrase [Streptomyces albipurpureus]|uniref:Tyrosine-type recombinase/integrase n=1 Tax=Streptomyces albipurpureus TaxID=2897419 RepID=A0ABT0UL57_9ACTN|nr:tyrosine-type recombinase/integrase [Streptomyces sp. CWNU-1]MCM2388749.1 tyrosine-type recombinase/integrase [Streptomyces sp. CWNU-1]